MHVHGQTLVGRLRALISPGNKQGWFEYDCEGQRAACPVFFGAVAVRERGGVVPCAALRGCFAIRADIVPEPSEWDGVRAG